MSDNLYTFPRNELDALAIFYVQNVIFPKMDLETLTPEDLMNAYLEAYDQFKEANIKLRQAAKTTKKWF